MHAVTDRLDARRGDAVVCVSATGSPELLAECLASVREHTDPAVPVLIAGEESDAGAPGSTPGAAANVSGGGESAIAAISATIAATAPADVVLLGPACLVAPGWLEGLRRAAHSDSSVAIAGALAGPAQVPVEDLARAAGAVGGASLRLYPRVLAPRGHCVYIRRDALELVGGLDESLATVADALVDLAQRCLLRGLVSACADDVLVLDRSPGPSDTDGQAPIAGADREGVLDERYPYLRRAERDAAAAESGPLKRSLAAARLAIGGLSVTIDARCLGPVVMGTQVHTLEVITALSAGGGIRLRVIVAPELGDYARERLAGLERVELMAHTEVHPAMEKTTVAHRPYQVSDANDLLMLRCTGERSLVTHQDLIGFRNPGYFPGYRQWAAYRRLTRQALAVADRVLFFSRHAAGDALREDLLDAAHATIVPIGVDHSRPGGPARAPAGAEAIGERPMLLCLGADLRHKNRVFALRLLGALRAEHGWEGCLVLAGPSVGNGSSASEEADYLTARAELRERVVSIGAVSEAEKAWLLERSTAVLYPTTYEGFGLMPFEAAAYGRPCLFASQTALAEVLPSELATLVPWNESESAARVSELLGTPGAGEAQAQAIRRAGERFTWRATAAALLDAYRETASASARVETELAGELAAVELERAESERKYNELWRALTPEARVLVAPGGELTPAQTGALAAIARRPLLRRALFGPAELAHRMTAGGRAASADAPPVPASAEDFDLHFAWANREHMREQLAATDRAVLEPEP